MKYEIGVRRTEVIAVEVEADTYEEAQEKAMDVAYNTNFHEEGDCDGYSVEQEDGSWKGVG